MALAIRNAAPLRPEIRLAQALSEYEAILSDTEKSTLRVLRACRPPCVADVMKLTAEIDFDNRQRKSRRCVGPRLTSILEAVQQFSTIVDVIIGGSQSLIASSIWGTLKMTLQITWSFTSYFEELSALFMRIGRTCPRYQDYGSLYPRSARLQGALCDYFCSVIEVCKKAVIFIKKPLITQLGASLMKPFSSEFGKLEKILSALGLAIRDEASLVSKQEISQESKENASFRSLFMKKSDQEIELASKLQREKRKLELLSACSSYNHQTAWKRARKAGTSSWILETEAYHQWVKESTSSVLWCTGILGSGKTVLAASLIQDTIVRHPENSVCYFFCNYDDAESLKARTILGSLAKQLLSSISPDRFKTTEKNFEEPLDEDEILALVVELFSQRKLHSFILIDGLDECRDVELNSLFSYLTRLLESSHCFHIFCTSRPDLDPKYRDRLQPQRLVTLSSSMDVETARYIEDQLQIRLETDRLSLGDPAIVLAIQDALLQRSQGMFLWVAFQLDSICAALTDEAILAALERLPKDLPETFDRVLCKLYEEKSSDPVLARKIFALISTAQRPLTVAEIREAIGITPGEIAWDPRKLINDMSKALGGCGSLLIVDEEDSTVHFTHHSVRQYILSSSDHSIAGRYHVDLHTADLLMGEICVTYLNLGIFNTQVTKTSTRNMLQTRDVTLAVMNEAGQRSTAINKVAVKLLKKRKKQPDFDLEVYLRTIASQTQSFTYQAQEFHAFLSYARAFWIFHSKNFQEEQKVAYGLCLRLLSGQVSSTAWPWSAEQMSQPDDKLIRYAIEQGNGPLMYKVSELLMRNEKSLFHPTIRRWRYTHLTSSTPLESSSDGELKARILALTFKLDSDKIFPLLRKAYIDINMRDSLGRTALLLCIQHAEDDMSMALLSQSEVDVNSPDFHGLTPLAAAVQTSNLQIINLLLSREEVNINAKSYSGTVLHEAVYRRNDDVVRLLLARKDLEVNATDQNLRTALILATEIGCESITKLLLTRSDINLNAKGNGGFTALHMAVNSGSLEVVRLLLERSSVNVNATDLKGDTPLHYAIRALPGFEKIAKELLQRREIDIDVQNITGYTPLALAQMLTLLYLAQMLKEHHYGIMRPRTPPLDAMSAEGPSKRDVPVSEKIDPNMIWLPTRSIWLLPDSSPPMAV